MIALIFKLNKDEMVFVGEETTSRPHYANLFAIDGNNRVARNAIEDIVSFLSRLYSQRRQIFVSTKVKIRTEIGKSAPI